MVLLPRAVGTSEEHQLSFNWQLSPARVGPHDPLPTRIGCLLTCPAQVTAATTSACLQWSSAVQKPLFHRSSVSLWLFPPPIPFCGIPLSLGEGSKMPLFTCLLDPYMFHFLYGTWVHQFTMQFCIDFSAVHWS